MKEIREQIQRMRSRGVEPELVSVSLDLYAELGRPRYFMGVYVDCNRQLKRNQFEVR